MYYELSFSVRLVDLSNSEPVQEYLEGDTWSTKSWYLLKSYNNQCFCVLDVFMLSHVLELYLASTLTSAGFLALELLYDVTQQLMLTTQLYLVFQEGNIKCCCYSLMICWYSFCRFIMNT